MQQPCVYLYRRIRLSVKSHNNIIYLTTRGPGDNSLWVFARLAKNNGRPCAPWNCENFSCVIFRYEYNCITIHARKSTTSMRVCVGGGGCMTHTVNRREKKLRRRRRQRSHRPRRRQTTHRGQRQGGMCAPIYYFQYNLYIHVCVCVCIYLYTYILYACMYLGYYINAFTLHIFIICVSGSIQI